MPDRIELVEAARRLRIPYARAHRYALTGRLEAERVEGRWVVSTRSVERIERELRGERKRVAR
jgi:hypothetical protein